MAQRLRIAGYQDESSVHTRAVRVMMQALARSAPEIQVEFEPNIAARGRKAAELLDLVASGDLDLCYFSSSYLSERVPSLGVFDIPFLFADRERTRRHLDDALGGGLKHGVAANTPYVVLAFWDNGLRHISNSKRPLRTPDDCKSLRIRTLPSAGYHATFRALGMEPVTIDAADMVRAIANGEVDAQENPLTNIRLFGLERYHCHVTTTAHFHGITLVLCNAQTWSGWPQSIRDALSAALAEATTAQWRFSAADDVACRAELTAQGVQIIDLDTQAREAFDRAVAAVANAQRAALPQEIARLLPV